jgi:hypothetical protein
MSRVFKTGSLKSFAWMFEVIALSSADEKNLKLLHAPKRSTPVTIKITSGSCDFRMAPFLREKSLLA